MDKEDHQARLKNRIKINEDDLNLMKMACERFQISYEDLQKQIVLLSTRNHELTEEIKELAEKYDRTWLCIDIFAGDRLIPQNGTGERNEATLEIFAENNIIPAKALLEGSKKIRSQLGKKGASARHNAAGGSREKANKIREAWASGKYQSRDICAEQECASLGMSFSSARKALRGTPDPASHNASRS